MERAGPQDQVLYVSCYVQYLCIMYMKVFDEIDDTQYRIIVTSENNCYLVWFVGDSKGLPTKILKCFNNKNQAIESGVAFTKLDISYFLKDDMYITLL